MTQQNAQWIIDSEKRTASHRHSRLIIQFEGNPHSSSFGIAKIYGNENHSHLDGLALIREGANAFREAFSGQTPASSIIQPAHTDGPKIKVKKRRRLASTQ